MSDSAASGEAADRIHVLLIEDNPGDARLITEELTHGRRDIFDLERVARLGEGLRRLEGNHVDVVLLDLSLPDSHGLATLSQVREHAPQTPIVVLTGLDDEDMAMNAMKEGAQDYLLKEQITPDALSRSIRYAIERNRLRLELLALSLVDELTGLYNRRGFLTLARQQLTTAARLGKRALLVFADLDGMKRINDELGHEAGDRALTDTAAALRETFRKADIVSRLGGDEFVAMTLINDADHPDRIVARLRAKVEEQNASGDKLYHLSVSVGAFVVDQGEVETPVEELIKQADERMYEEKRLKKLARDAQDAQGR